MRIVVTGSSGWLGRHLCPALRAAGHRVTGLDLAPGPETQVVGSVATRAVVDRAFGFGADAVVHAAALHQPDLRKAPMRSFAEVNIGGTINVLDAARAAGCCRFVLVSSTSLMIDAAIAQGTASKAAFLDETHGPLAPRNVYGVTKLAAEGLARLHAETMAVTVLRLSRFFPEDDSYPGAIRGDNLKAVELLHRRLSVDDAAASCLAALARADPGFALYLVSAPTPFARDEAADLMRNAADVIARHYPDAPALFAVRGWHLPRTITRVYESRRIADELGFRCATDFAAVLQALRQDAPLPFATQG